MVPPLRLLKVEPKTAIKISNLLWGQFQYSTYYLKAKILFVGQSKKRDRILKIAQEVRTSFWPTARRAGARRATLNPSQKFNGRLCEPPTKWRQKNQIVLSRHKFTTKLEPIFSRISD